MFHSNLGSSVTRDRLIGSLPNFAVDILGSVPTDVGGSLHDPATSLELGFLERLFLDFKISGRPNLKWPLLVIPCINVPRNSHCSISWNAPTDMGVQVGDLATFFSWSRFPALIPCRNSICFIVTLNRVYLAID
jgi:hypothetical protein